MPFNLLVLTFLIYMVEISICVIPNLPQSYALGWQKKKEVGQSNRW